MSAGPAPTAFDPGPWSRILAESAQRHRVPGMVAGVVHLDRETGRAQRFVASTGLTNLDTRVPTDRHTVCQIGSITKVVTATMIMQLKEEGRLDLDTLASELLPGLALGSGHTGTITVRHLLTHTSGIDGDLFTDTGRGDDCVERYVASLAEAQALFAPETGWSYCNSGFVLLGRIIEVLDERSWDASLRARITAPLGLTRFVTLPEEALRHRAAYGHIRYPGAPDWSPAPSAMITRSMGPAGLVSSSADDLLTFAAAFLRGGGTGDSDALLSAESVAEMTDRQWVLDPAAGQMAPEWGLGWMRDDWGGHRVFWHGGTTIGQNAWLQVLPDDGLALVVFCNGGNAPTAAAEVYTAMAAEFADAPASRLLVPSGPASAAAVQDHWLGRYSDASTTVVVRRTADAALEAVLHSKLDRTHPEGQVLSLLPAEGTNHFVCRPDDVTPWAGLSFTEVDGEPVVYLGIRALPKRSDQEAA